MAFSAPRWRSPPLHSVHWRRSRGQRPCHRTGGRCPQYARQGLDHPARQHPGGALSPVRQAGRRRRYGYRRRRHCPPVRQAERGASGRETQIWGPSPSTSSRTALAFTGAVVWAAIPSTSGGTAPASPPTPTRPTVPHIEQDRRPRAAPPRRGRMPPVRRAGRRPTGRSPRWPSPAAGWRAGPAARGPYRSAPSPRRRRRGDSPTRSSTLAPRVSTASVNSL